MLSDFLKKLLNIKIEKQKLIEYFILTSVILIYLIIIRFVTGIKVPPDPTFYYLGDHYYYIKMAENPLTIFNGNIRAPFCYRVLTPFISWLLPFDLATNFQIITYTSFFFIGIILYVIFKNLFGKILAFTGLTLFYTLQFAARYLFYNFWVVDSLAFFF